MGYMSILFNDVSFAYDRASHPLIAQLTVSFSRGWTGVVGANGAGKTTLLKLACGILHTVEGTVHGMDHGIYCPQRTDDIPDRMVELMHTMDGNAFEIKGRLGIEADWLSRWDSLSHGERKRAQISVALWQHPSILAVDEPTNHLDTEAQAFLFDGLSRFRGIGLLVSHDRALLDALCHQCLFLDPPDAILRNGNYTVASNQLTMERIAAQKQREQAKQAYDRLRKEAVRRRDAASRSHRKRSKRGLALKDHDAKAKINLARITGKDGADGRRLKQLDGRMSQALERKDNISVKKQYEMGIWMPGALSKRNTLFKIPAGQLSLGNNRKLEFPDLVMKPDDRIAFTGINGAGKSTLVSHIMQSLDLPKEHVTYVPQEIDMNASRAIIEQARHLPKAVLGRMMTVVSRLGSRPQRLLESITPSPGEVRKILIATGIANIPYLIVMDEPTNHLDLPSIECLEQALTDCPCGLLLVSHDQRFLESLTRKRWDITGMDQHKQRFILNER